MKRLGQRKLRRFEMLLVLCVVAITIGIFLQRMAEVAADSERVNADQSVVNINSVLTQLVVRHAVTGKLNDLAAYADTNPMELLHKYAGRRPENYLGELSDNEARQAAPGFWFFNRQARELVYRYRSDGSELRLRMQFEYTDNDVSGDFDPQADRIIGLYLLNNQV